MMDEHVHISEVSTEALIGELLKRGSVLVEVGPFKELELKRKYSSDRGPVRADAVLILNHLAKV